MCVIPRLFGQISVFMSDTPNVIYGDETAKKWIDFFTKHDTGHSFIFGAICLYTNIKFSQWNDQKIVNVNYKWSGVYGLSRTSCARLSPFPPLRTSATQAAFWPTSNQATAVLFNFLPLVVYFNVSVYAYKEVHQHEKQIIANLVSLTPKAKLEFLRIRKLFTAQLQYCRARDFPVLFAGKYL